MKNEKKKDYESKFKFSFNMFHIYLENIMDKVYNRIM